MPVKNPWNNRTALFAVVVAFSIGVLGALASLRVKRQKRPRLDYQEQLGQLNLLPGESLLPLGRICQR